MTLYPTLYLFPQDVEEGMVKTAGKVFLLTWKFFTSKIVREFTLMSAPSFGKYMHIQCHSCQEGILYMIAMRITY